MPCVENILDICRRFLEVFMLLMDEHGLLSWLFRWLYIQAHIPLDAHPLKQINMFLINMLPYDRTYLPTEV